MDLDAATAIALCHKAHQRFLVTALNVDDHVVRKPSLLPRWTVGHVLTHVARNADGHERRLAAALEGREEPRYPGGKAQRGTDIEEGAMRPAADIRQDLADAIDRLEAVWERSRQAGWPNAEMLAGDRFPTTESPVRRLREVEVHHVDLGLGYEPAAWPEEYVRWELPRVLEGLPPRMRDHRDSARLVAWLIGRADAPVKLDFGPWL